MVESGAMANETDNVTALLNAWTGDDDAAEQLASLIYPQMRRIAQGLFAGERCDHTLQPTALVHEAYGRLKELHQLRWHDREHFLSMAARIMRRVLVDHARARLYQKRGAGQEKAPLEDALTVPVDMAPQLVALHDALSDLERFDPQKAAIVELHYFGGYSFEQIAGILGCSRSTAIRQWNLARTWLLKEMS